MKKSGILNAQLSRAIAELGHKDLFMVGDAGMPIPRGVEVIDLALCRGVPTFEQALGAVLDDAEVEQYYLAEEIEENNARLLAFIKETLPGRPCVRMPHTELKEMSRRCRFAIRTGECSPYPNVILQAGVTF